MNPVVRDTDTTQVVELASWCRLYQNFGIHKLTTAQRFACGVYQLHQGIGWLDVVAEYKQYESFAAAALHIMMTAESEKQCVAESPFWDVQNICEWSFIKPDYRDITYLISSAQQQVFYNMFITGKPGYQRMTRFKPIELRDRLARLSRELFSVIPPGKRSEAIEQASSIMTRKL